MSTVKEEQEQAKSRIAIQLAIFQYRDIPYLKMTDKELAKAAGVSLNTILRLKDPNSPYLPRLSTIIKVAKALDINYLWLLG